MRPNVTCGEAVREGNKGRLPFAMSRVYSTSRYREDFWALPVVQASELGTNIRPVSSTLANLLKTTRSPWPIERQILASARVDSDPARRRSFRLPTDEIEGEALPSLGFVRTRADRRVCPQIPVLCGPNCGERSPQPLCQFRSRVATIGAQLLYRRGLCQQFQDDFRDTFGHITNAP